MAKFQTQRSQTGCVAVITASALLSAPQENLALAAPDNSFAWSACTYSLTTCTYSLMTEC